MAENRPLLLLMDGHAMVFRAWFSIPERLSSSTGQDTRGVYGFLNQFLRVIREHRPTHAALTLDTPAPTFRDEMYPAYKATRPPAPEDLKAQIPLLKGLMEAFNVPVYELDGYEADDLLGTLSRRAAEHGMDTLIVTGDRDILQLISPTVRVLLYTGFDSKTYDEEAFRSRWGGLPPSSLPDIKALEGDPSDNIPGVPRIGAKTALRLLQGRERLEGIYSDLDGVEKSGIRGAKGIRRILEENRDLAFMGRKLTTIVTDAPVEFDPESARFWRYDRAAVVDYLAGLGFSTIIARVPRPDGSAPSRESSAAQLAFTEEDAGKPDPAPAGSDAKYATVASLDDLKSLAARLATPAGFAFDTETSGIDPMQSDLVGLSFSNAEAVAWYVPVGHAEGEQVPREEALEVLRPLFADPAVPKVAHNANFDLMVLAEAGVKVVNVSFDTMIAAALCGRRQIGLKQLALECFRAEMTPIKDLIGAGRKQISMAQVSVEKASPYAAADADYTWRLKAKLDAELDVEQARRVFEDIEMPLLPVIVRMQRNGVRVDTGALQEMSHELGAQLAKLIGDTRELLAGREVNLNSTRQLGAILFDELGVPKTRRTKTGYTLDAGTLEGLRQREDLHPTAFELINNVLAFRELSKLKSTYVDALPRLVNPKTGRVHTSFNQVGSSTGRLSSADPNIQNIPVRTELGRRVRKAFVADAAAGWTLLSADYSQIELRILAHLSQEPALLKAFHDGEDIHAATARAMYEIPDSQPVTPDQRRIAKVLNFGVIYGLGPHGVAMQTDLSREQGRRFIDMYFSKYPGIRGYIDAMKETARTRGYVETITGRRRRLPELASRNRVARAAAERMAVNMPIQGTAADAIKIAMINIDREMDRRGLLSRMTVQVHDELIFEVAPGELEEMRDLVTELMPAAMDLAVPLTVEVKSGPTWGDME